MSNKNQAVLEINGKRYNATTGALLDDVRVSATKPMPKVSDITKATKATAKSSANSKPAPSTSGAAVKATKKVMDVRRAGPKPVQAHQPERTHTLMRTAVKKPTPGMKRSTKVVASTDILAKVPTISIVPKWSFHNIDPEKRRRAQRIARSHLVKRFAPQVVYLKSSPSAAVATSANIPAQTSTSSNHSMDIFQHALAKADAHHEPAFDPKKHAKAVKKAARHAKRQSHHWGKRIASVSSIALAVAVLAGFIAYQNRTDLALHVASVKAGFQASLPGYRPAGFAVGKLQYGSGFVAINFHSAASDRNYTVSQKSSNWDSETLLDNFVAANNKSYQTIVNGGRTIYLYGDNDASWVDNGIWYQVNSGGSLSSTDVLDIASST